MMLVPLQVMGRVGEALPGSGTVLLVDGEGKVLWQQTGANDSADLSGVVTGLRRTSRQLGMPVKPADLQPCLELLPETRVALIW